VDDDVAADTDAALVLASSASRFCLWTSTSRIKASNRANELSFSSPGISRSEPGMHRSWNALSRMVSRGPGGEPESIIGGS